VAEVTFAFTPAPELLLVNVTAMHAPRDPEAAAVELAEVAGGLSDLLGPPAREAGDRTAARLGALPYSTFTLSYRFHDYFADLTSTNLPGRGVMVYEHYMSMRD